MRFIKEALLGNVIGNVEYFYGMFLELSLRPRSWNRSMLRHKIVLQRIGPHYVINDVEYLRQDCKLHETKGCYSAEVFGMTPPELEMEP